ARASRELQISELNSTRTQNEGTRTDDGSLKGVSRRAGIVTMNLQGHANAQPTGKSAIQQIGNLRYIITGPWRAEKEIPQRPEIRPPAGFTIQFRALRLVQAIELAWGGGSVGDVVIAAVIDGFI